MEALGERLSDEACANLTVHLPDRLASRLPWGCGEGPSFVWEFHVRLARKVGIAPSHAARYARQVGSVLAGAVLRAELAGARDELPREYWELAERVLPDPHRDGSLERV